jgi:hypothetical protein
VKLHPFRAAQVGKHILRERMVAKIAKSSEGQRVVRECQAALDLPVNSDQVSRRFVLKRFAMELDLFPNELEGLLPIPEPRKVNGRKEPAKKPFVG